MDKNQSILKIENIVKYFDISGGLLDQLKFQNGKFIRKKITVKAVNNVSMTINKGETLSVVGESGCGKFTLARVVIGLYPPNLGKIYYKNERIDHLTHKEMLPFRKKMQKIFLQNLTIHIKKALLNAIPKIGSKKEKHIRLKGEIPTSVNLPTGCVFHGRCIYADKRCANEIPLMRKMENGTCVACHAVEENRDLDCI